MVSDYIDIYTIFFVVEAGDVTCLATIPIDVKAEATFIAKEDGVIAGISLAEMIFNEVDPSLKVTLISVVSYFTLI